MDSCKKRGVLAVLMFGLIVGGDAVGAEFVVDAFDDAIDAAPGDGICATASGTCTLRAAVNEANALAGPDRIFLGAGTHVLSLAGTGEDGGLTGDLDVRDDLEIEGIGRDESIIDGGGIDTTIDLRGARLSLAGLSLTGGDTRAYTLYAFQADLLVRGVRLAENVAAPVIRAQLATVEMEDVVIEDNEGTAMQFADCFVTVRDCVVRRNDGTGAGGESAGLRSSGAGVVVATSSEFHGDARSWGVRSLSGVLIGHGLTIMGNPEGGVDARLWPGSTPIGSWLRSCRITGNHLGVTAVTPLVIADCDISNNASTHPDVNSGFGVSISTSRGRSLVLRSSITNNGPNVGQGGGLWLRRDVDVVDSLISGNTALRGGGGLRIVIDDPSRRTRLFGCTIVGNHDDERGGGISINDGMSVLMSNTILQDNTAGILGDDCDGTVELIGPSLIGLLEPAACLLTGDVGELLEGLDPMLLPLGDFGGPTPSRPPAPGSPAIDAGSPAPVGGGPPACSERDQRGVIRPQGAWCDLGAVEVCDDLSGLDTDGDGVLDDCDVCPLVADEQRDQDRDGLGDACDAECGDEPSALDLNPTAPPLRVSKFSEVPEWIEFADESGWIELTWEADGVESDHELVRGSLAGLHAGYDHRGFGACRLPSGWLAMPPPRENSYFLVIGRCGDVRAAPGRDSFGVERPQPSDACR